MTNELFASLGIDPSLPAQRVLELLQDKNLEYLERLDACTDPARVKELTQKQQEIETAILSYSTGLTLDRRIREREQAPSESSAAAAAPNAPPTDPLSAALLDYQAGNYEKALPVLREFAQQGDALACVLAANLLKQGGENRDARRYLFIAAQQGDATATLMLAQQYFQELNPVAAQEWAEKAVKQQTPGSGRLLSQLTNNSIEPLFSEMNWASGYDRYTLTREICDLLVANKLSLQERFDQLKRLQTMVAGDKRCVELVQTHLGRVENSKSVRKTWIVTGSVISFLFAAFFSGLFTAIFGPFSSVWGRIGLAFLSLMATTLCILIMLKLLDVQLKRHPEYPFYTSKHGLFIAYLVPPLLALIFASAFPGLLLANLDACGVLNELWEGRRKKR